MSFYQSENSTKNYAARTFLFELHIPDIPPPIIRTSVFIFLSSFGNSGNSVLVYHTDFIVSSIAKRRLNLLQTALFFTDPANLPQVYRSPDYLSQDRYRLPDIQRKSELRASRIYYAILSARSLTFLQL